MNYATAITFLMLSVAATADKTASFSVDDKVALAEGSLRGQLVSAETHAGVRTVLDDKPNTSPTETDPINNGNKIESFVTYSRGADSCSGTSACIGAGHVGEGSCNGPFACAYREGDVGNHSCNGEYVCDDSPSTVGNDSCNGHMVCEEEYDNIGNGERNDVGCEKWKNTNGYCWDKGKSVGGQLGGYFTAEGCLAWCQSKGNGCCLRNIQDRRCMWARAWATSIHPEHHHDWRSAQCHGGSSVLGDLTGFTIEG